MMLKGKVAVIYGAGGAIGGAVAHAFAKEGATVFLTGLHGAAVEAVAKDIVAAGGSAEAAEVNALDEQAVDKHLQSAIVKANRIDDLVQCDRDLGSRDSRCTFKPDGCQAVLPADYGVHNVVLPDRTFGGKAHDPK